MHSFDFIILKDETMILWNCNHITTKPLDFFKWSHKLEKENSNKIIGFAQPFCGTVVQALSCDMKEY